MPTGKPLIAILMAVYNPRFDWLKLQLESLNAQTYPNLRLYIRDDCSPSVPFADIEKLVAQCITAFPYTITRNEKNLGSNLTFEQLTQEAEGEYFAYCDQDDIWLPEKLTVLQQTIEAENAALVCSDMFIIDGNGKQIADSITKIRRNHVFRSGTGLTDTLWYSNFAAGCALLVRADPAKRAIPFNPYMFYDHYITLFCANEGCVFSLPEKLILHREHGENQSSLLQGVHDRDSYRLIRIDRKADEVHWLYKNFSCEEPLKRILSEGDVWMTARQEYARGNRTQWKTIWKYRHYSPKASVFELASPYLPDPIFRGFLWVIRNNYFKEVHHEDFHLRHQRTAGL